MLMRVVLTLLVIAAAMAISTDGQRCVGFCEGGLAVTMPESTQRHLSTTDSLQQLRGEQYANNTKALKIDLQALMVRTNGALLRNDSTVSLFVRFLDTRDSEQGESHIFKVSNALSVRRTDDNWIVDCGMSSMFRPRRIGPVDIIVSYGEKTAVHINGTNVMRCSSAYMPEMVGLGGYWSEVNRADWSNGAWWPVGHIGTIPMGSLSRVGIAAAGHLSMSATNAPSYHYVPAPIIYKSIGSQQTMSVNFPISDQEIKDMAAYFALIRKRRAESVTMNFMMQADLWPGHYVVDVFVCSGPMTIHAAEEQLTVIVADSISILPDCTMINTNGAGLHFNGRRAVVHGGVGMELYGTFSADIIFFENYNACGRARFLSAGEVRGVIHNACIGLPAVNVGVPEVQLFPMIAVVDDVFLFGGEVTREEAWMLHLGHLPIHLDKVVSHHSSMEDGWAEESVVLHQSNGDYSLLIPYGQASSSIVNNPFPARQLDYGYDFKCSGSRSSEECFRSCLTPSAVCSGDHDFCAFIDKWRSEPNTPIGLQIPAACKQQQVSECHCRSIKLGTVRTIKDKDGRGQATGVKTMIEENHHVTVSSFPADVYGVHPDVDDDIHRCMGQGAAAGGASWPGSCWQQGAGRRLLSAGEQFEITITSGLLRVNQDIAARTCASCTETEVYNATAEINGQREVFAVIGLYTTKELSPAMRTESGIMTVSIRDKTGTILAFKSAGVTGRFSLDVPDCILCMDALHSARQMSSFWKSVWALIIVLIIYMCIMILRTPLTLVTRACAAAGGGGCSLISRLMVKKEPIEVSVQLPEVKPLIRKGLPTLTPTSWKAIRAFSLVILSVVGVSGQVCSNGIFIPVAVTECNAGVCTKVMSLTGNVPKGGKSWCINLIDKSVNKPAGTLLVSIENFDRRVPYKFSYLTSSFEGMFDAHKSCAGSSPANSVGTNVGPQDNPDGMFSENAFLMKNTGRTTARGVCGCAGCGCFRCDSAVTYSRYALVTDAFPVVTVSERIDTEEWVPTVKVEWISDAGTRTTLQTSEMVINQELMVDAPKGKIRISLQAFLGDGEMSDSPEKYLVQGKKTIHFGLPFFYTNILPDTRYWTGDSGFVSDVGKPKANLLGDIQWQASVTDKQSYQYDPAIVIKDEGSSHDSYRFLKSGFDNALPSMTERNLTGGSDGWRIVPGKSELTMVKSSGLAEKPIVFKIVTGEDFGFELEKPMVCFDKDLSIQTTFTGYFSSTKGCHAEFKVKSTCQAGLAVVTCTDPMISLMTHSVSVGTDETAIVLNALCSDEILTSSTCELASGDHKLSINVGPSRLNTSDVSTTTNNVFTTGTHVESSNENDVGFNSSDLTGSSPFAKILDWVSDLGGGRSWFNTIIGTMMIGVIVMVVVVGIPYMKKMVEGAREQRASKKDEKEKA